MSFPTTSVLDTFGGTLGSWTNSTFGDSALTISSGQLTRSGAGYGSAVWTSPFAADQEVFFDVPTVDAGNEVGLILRAGLSDHYTVSWFTAGSYAVIRHVGASDVSILTGTQAFAAGDSLGASIVGSVVTMYRKPSGSSWSLVNSVTDTSPLAGVGSIGVSIHASTFRVDNFGGGSISSAITSTFSVNF